MDDAMKINRQWLRNARVYDHEVLADIPPIADVLIADGEILAVGDEAKGKAGDAERIDLSGHLLLPGFVNAHYHSHDVLAKGFFEAMPNEQWGLIAGAIANGRPLQEVRARTLIGAIECLRNGITTVQDFASFAPMDEATSQTQMEYGGITPIGLPADWPVLIDEAVAASGLVVIGSGIRGSKILIAGATVAAVPAAVNLPLALH